MHSTNIDAQLQQSWLHEQPLIAVKHMHFKVCVGDWSARVTIAQVQICYRYSKQYKYKQVH